MDLWGVFFPFFKKKKKKKKNHVLSFEHFFLDV